MVSPLLIGPLLEVGKTLLDRFGPEDKAERAKAEAEFLRMASEGDLKKVLAQLEINAREAAHPSVWVSGWRPAFGWCGAVAFLYATIGQPLLAWYAATRGLPVPPTLNMDLLWAVITGLLGIGGLRSVEKIKGAAK